MIIARRRTTKTTMATPTPTDDSPHPPSLPSSSVVVGLLPSLCDDALRMTIKCTLVSATIMFMGFFCFNPSTYFPINLDATTISSNLFEWKCCDTCSCLPPVIVNKKSTIISFHQSYKTSDPQGWKEGWENYRRTWLKLHPESWRFIFWTDSQNDLLASCSGYPNLLSGRSGIQKADLSRLLYLHTYGGLYVDLWITLPFETIENCCITFPQHYHSISKIVSSYKVERIKSWD